MGEKWLIVKGDGSSVYERFLTKADAEKAAQQTLTHNVNRIVSDLTLDYGITSGDGQTIPESPPSSFLLALLLPVTKSGDIIANMEELYHETWVPKYGLRKAKWIWRLQSLQFIAWRWAWPITFIWGAIKAIKPG